MVGAVKPAEDGDGVVLRCVNVLDAPVEGLWLVPGGIVAAVHSELDERRGAPARLSQDGTVVQFVAPPRAIVTLRLAPRSKEIP